MSTNRTLFVVLQLEAKKKKHTRSQSWFDTLESSYGKSMPMVAQICSSGVHGLNHHSVQTKALAAFRLLVDAICNTNGCSVRSFMLEFNSNSNTFNTGVKWKLSWLSAAVFWNSSIYDINLSLASDLRNTNTDRFDSPLLYCGNIKHRLCLGNKSLKINVKCWIWTGHCCSIYRFFSPHDTYTLDRNPMTI